ncbi:hypothetical protein MATL_G00209270 [Megalops atlanticus]|uniref:Uncharacterized protein n=1 Tax=Megalops atlanticus TaxID=7932 RepID=A0A9D3PFG9_MEGAT|nr:hypothetical protein MATL_G00209270 [Megalops atlanticus]
MKPDGITTAMMKSMEASTEPAVQTGSMGEETQQAPPPPQPTEDEKSKPEMAPSAAKVGKSSKPGDLKAKTKGPTKTKAGPPGSKTTGTSGPRSQPSTAQNRTTENRTANSIQKPLTNGAAKKATTTAPGKKKATPTTAPPKRPVGTAGSPAKAADRKPIGATKPASSTSVTNSDKTASLSKRAPVEPSSNAKTKTKPTGPRPMSTTPSKSSNASVTKPDRPLVSKTTRLATASPAHRPMATATAMKVSTSPAKPSPSRPGSAVPSAGRTTATQPPKPTAPAKKDVSNPTAKKLSATSTCPSPTKASKPEIPKSVASGRSNSTLKKPASSGKVGEAKPSQPKQQELKPPAVLRGPKPAAGTTTTLSPKKPVGSSTPMPVKRGPKPTQTPAAMNTGEEVEAAIPAAEATTVCAALAAATSAAVTAAAPITAAAAAAVAEAVVAAVATVGSRSPVKPDVVTQDKLEPELELVHLPLLAVVLGARNTPSPRPAVQPVDEPAGAASVLGTTVLSPPSSPPGPATLPAPQSPSFLLDLPHHTPDLFLATSPGSPSQSPLGGATEPASPWAEVEQQEAIPTDDLQAAALISLTQEREEAVEKAEEELNEDDEEEEEREGEKERKVSKPVQVSDVSRMPLMDEYCGGSSDEAGRVLWAGKWDSEDARYCQQGMSEVSVHTKGEELSAGSASLPVNEEEEEEEKEQGFDMGMSLGQMDQLCRVEQEEEEEDEDVEMVMTESYRNANKDNLTEDWLSSPNAVLVPPVPLARPWGQASPLVDPWAEPAGLTPHHWAVDPVAALPPAQAWLEFSSTSLRPEAEEFYPQDTAPTWSPDPLAPLALGMGSMLSGPELAVHSSSDTSTPEELCDFDSSSGVESRSEEKQRTPLPPLQADVEQDLGIHLERGDEEEEAETLPADEVLGGPPTAPMSAPSSPSASCDEASDAEGEAWAGDQRGCRFANLEEAEEAGEEDGGTPQSANSATSCAFDSNTLCITESCGQSPGIFSLENEDQLPEEAKDPSLICELTLPGGAANTLPGAQANLLPLDLFNAPDPQYMLCGKPGAELTSPGARGGAAPLEACLLLPPHGEGPEAQPLYYSTICDNTDSVVAGNV